MQIIIFPVSLIKGLHIDGIKTAVAFEMHHPNEVP